MNNTTKVLNTIRAELKAPKTRSKKGLSYKYRSLEDVFEAVKPLLSSHDATVSINTDVISINDRTFFVARATFRHLSDGENNAIESTGIAELALEQRGMQQAQLSGATMSYATKYALNNLFLIDDSRDIDKEGGSPDKPVLADTTFMHAIKKIKATKDYGKQLDRVKILETQYELNEFQKAEIVELKDQL